MPLSKNLNTYNDVLQVLTTARANGGATYTLKTPGAAMNWVARAYHFRTLLTKTAIARAGAVKGFIPSTDWDDLLLEREGDRIKISFNRVAGKLTDDNGAELALTKMRVEPGASEMIIGQLAPSIKRETAPDFNLDELEEAAAQLKRSEHLI